MTALASLTGEEHTQCRVIHTQLDVFAMFFDLEVVDDDGFLQKSPAEQMLIG